MWLFIFISILVLPCITCTASKSLACPRANALSLSVDRIQTSKKKWSKRAPHRALQDPISTAIRDAEQPFAKGTGFTISRTMYEQVIYKKGPRRKKARPATLKTYFGTGHLEAFHEDMDKWTRGGGGFLGSQEDTRGGRLYMILNNTVPADVNESEMHTAIKNAFSLQISETPEREVPAFLDYILNNPQELKWEKGYVSAATPIYFATQNPIDAAISLPGIPPRQPLAEGGSFGNNFVITRTVYKSIPVTLKTYIGVTGSLPIAIECGRWKDIGLLIGTAVGLRPGHEFYSMILGNFVPEISTSYMNSAIIMALSEHTGEISANQAHALTNPQEFAWIHWGHDHWTPTRILFITNDPIDKAIRSARHSKSFANGPGFSLFRARYNDEDVTLKTYFATTFLMPTIRADCVQWTKIKALIATTVRLGSHYSKNDVQEFYMLLGNSVPPELEADDMDAAIRTAIGEGVKASELNNPHEFIWRKTKKRWIAKPIDFSRPVSPHPTVSHRSNK